MNASIVGSWKNSYGGSALMMNGVYLLGVSTCHDAQRETEKDAFSEPEPISFLKSER